MSNGIETISEKPIDEMTYKEVWRILLKRIIAFPSKVIGFKGLSFGISVWLLTQGKISDWTFLIILIIVLFGKDAPKFFQNLKR